MDDLTLGRRIDVSSFFPSDASLANGIDVQSLCLERGKYKVFFYDFNNNSGVRNYYIESNGETIAQGGEVGFAEETIGNVHTATYLVYTAFGMNM